MAKRSKESPGVELRTKLAPSQDRARATFELILDVTGQLLGEVGVERLSTNMICVRAGITPPALYRYFPNKYAILREMGRRLMEAEDAIVLEWLEQGHGHLDGSLEEAIKQRADLLTRVRKVAREQPGGEWIQLVMRAVPVLREVRANSVDTVARAIVDQLGARYPSVDKGRLRTAALLSTTLANAASELIVDAPQLEEELTIETARMITLYYRDLVEASEGDGPAKES